MTTVVEHLNDRTLPDGTRVTLAALDDARFRWVLLRWLKSLR